jgi:cytochrome P450
MLLTILVVAVLAYAAYWLLNQYRYTSRCFKLLRGVPIVPGGIPFLGLAPYLTQGAPWNTFAGWAAKYGSTVMLDVLGTKIIYTTEPKLVRRVFQTNQKNYSKNVAFSYKHFMVLLGRGLVTAEGEKWKRNRILLSHAFRVELLQDVPRVAFNATIHCMDELRKCKERGTEIDLLEQYRVLTLEVITNAILSMTPEQSEEVFPHLYLPIATECNKRVWSPWRQAFPGPALRHVQLVGKLNSFFEKFVRTRKSLRDQEKSGAIPKRSREDILDRCMERMEETWDEKESVLQLRDDLKTFILAGHETSGTMLTWATYEVIRNPDVRDKIIAEHHAVFGKPGKGNVSLPTLDVLRSDLKWSLAVLRECLRLYSIVPMLPRTVDGDDTIPASEWGGSTDIVIPQGTIVMIGVDGLHHRADIWPDPYQFKPERFYDMSQVDEYSFIPFIVGPRNCLGQHLALLEASIVLSYMITYWDLELVSETEKREGIKRHPLVVPLSPENGLRVRGTPRHPIPSRLQ